MIALIRKNLRLWGYGKSLALFTGCILFSISGRLNGGIAYERHILSAVSDHYYLTYFVLPIVLLSCFSFIDDDGEPVILRFQSYHSYFLKKWIGVGLIAVILTAVQTGAILLSGICVCRHLRGHSKARRYIRKKCIRPAHSNPPEDEAIFD